MFENGYVLLDIETTSAVPTQARIVQAGLRTLLLTGGPTPYSSVFYAEFNPGVPVQPKSREIHGFVFDPEKTYTDLKAFLIYLEVAISRSCLLYAPGSVPLVGWNLESFVLPVLQNEAKRLGVTWRLPEQTLTVDLRQIHDSVCKKDMLLYSMRTWAGPIERDTTQPRAWQDVLLMEQALASIDKAIPIQEQQAAIKDERVDAAGKIIKKDGELWFTFGKYNCNDENKSKPLGYIYSADYSYFKWLLNTEHMTPEFKGCLHKILSDMASHAGQAAEWSRQLRQDLQDEVAPFVEEEGWPTEF